LPATGAGLTFADVSTSTYEVLTVPDAGDPDGSIAIEVALHKQGPVSLALLTKLLSMGIVFLATRQLPASLAIVSVALSTFIPDLVAAGIRRLRWGKKRVGTLATLVSFFATIDSLFADALGRRLRSVGTRTLKTARAGARHAAASAGHTLGTSVAATALCAAAIAAPAIATGSSPFGSGRSAPRAQATTEVQGLQLGSSSWRSSLTVTPGQNAHIPLKLAHTSKVLLALDPASTLTRLTVSHDGGQDDQYYGSIDANSIYVVESLPSGRHTLQIEPDGIAAGTLRYTLYVAPPVTRQIVGSSTGGSGSVTVTPGQNAELTFALAHPGKILLAMSPHSTLTRLTVSHDGGQDDQYYGSIDANSIYVVESLPAGRHTLQIEPDGIAAGTLRYTLYTPGSE
jgi:hypothetical protein